MVCGPGFKIDILQGSLIVDSRVMGNPRGYCWEVRIFLLVGGSGITYISGPEIRFQRRIL